MAGSPPPKPSGPSLRTTVLATAAAVGSVATGAFTALLPTPGDGTTTAASADESLITAQLSANSSPLTYPASTGNPGTGYFSPVTFTLDDTAVPAVPAAAADQHLALLGKAADIATQLAEQHAQEQRAQVERDRIDTVIDEGGLDGWIAEALRVMDMPQSFAPGIKKIIMAESNGNPRAINNWDSNARRGTPSQGLMQTIPSTFRAFVHPSLAGRSITDPVANITAGVRYMIANYGLSTLQSGGRSSSSGSYLGY